MNEPRPVGLEVVPDDGAAWPGDFECVLAVDEPVGIIVGGVDENEVDLPTVGGGIVGGGIGADLADFAFDGRAAITLANAAADC